MAVTVANADVYFNDNVVHYEEWAGADEPKKQRALNQASKMLYRVYGFKYDPERNPVPEEAIYEQALWLLRLDDSIRKKDQGVNMIGVDGIQIMFANTDISLAPEVIRILGRRVGRTLGARVGYVVRGDKL